MCVNILKFLGIKEFLVQVSAWFNRQTSRDSFPKLVVGLTCFNSKAYPIQSAGGL